MLPTDRLDYAPITARRPLALPRAARAAVRIVVDVEEWDPQQPIPRTCSPRRGRLADARYPNWAWHEYGNRVGFWRKLEVLDEPASAWCSRSTVKRLRSPSRGNYRFSS